MELPHWDVFSEGSQTTEQESEGNLFFCAQKIKGVLLCVQEGLVRWFRQLHRWSFTYQTCCLLTAMLRGGGGSAKLFCKAAGRNPSCPLAGLRRVVPAPPTGASHWQRVIIPVDQEATPEQPVNKPKKGSFPRSTPPYCHKTYFIPLLNRLSLPWHGEQGS